MLESEFATRTFDVDPPIAHAWAHQRGRSRTVDGLLAATALVHGLTVVTRDTRPFERVGVPWLDPWST